MDLEFDPDTQTYTASPKGRRRRFGKTEIVHILIATVVLTAAFTLLYSGIRYSEPQFEEVFFRHYLGDSWMAGLFGLMFAIVVLSFVGHEMGHKFVAQDLGCWSEFRIYPTGLLLTLVTSIFGFIVALPGAVYIRGRISDEDNGRISIAGPLVNIVLGAIGIVGCLVFNGEPILIFFYLLLSLNASLAVFNMVPFPPLDGYKILRWNTGIWAATIAIAAIEFLCLFLGLLGDLYVSWARRENQINKRRTGGRGPRGCFAFSGVRGRGT